MNALVVYAHQEPTSLTASLKNVTLKLLTAAGHNVIETDLYGLGFHPAAELFDFNVKSEEHFNYLTEQKYASMHNMAFSPDITSEMEKLKNAEMVVFHFPVWWSAPPAILKGWLDRVLAMGFAWDGHGRIYQNGLMKGKRALVVTTAGDGADSYTPTGEHKASLDQLLFPLLHSTLGFCGFDVLQPYILYDVLDKNAEQLASMVELYRGYLERSLAAPQYYLRQSV